MMSRPVCRYWKCSAGTGKLNGTRAAQAFHVSAQIALVPFQVGFGRRLSATPRGGPGLIIQQSRSSRVILRWEKLEQRAMTTSKRQSHDKARRAASEPNLGQKAAEREKKSKAQLGHMEGRRATSARGRFVAWCKQEQASIQRQLELMQSGKVLTGENRGSGWVDTTDESVKRAKARLVELESLLTEKGSATISKP